MTKLHASHSSEFFAVREPGRLYVYRDSYLDLTHRVADQVAGDLIHLADNGDCFFRSNDGLFRLRREKGVRPERCKAVAGMDGTNEAGVLRGFQVRADGDQVAYEQVVPAQKFSSKLKRLLGQKSAQGDVGPSLHRFIVSGWSGRSSSCYYETVVDPRTSAGLIWWTSADFGFLAVLDRERDGRSHLRVIDVLGESVVNELMVDGKLSRDRAITTNGTVGFGLEKDGRRAFVIWTYAQERYQVAYPKESRLLHLSKDHAIFFNRGEHRLTVKTFKNQTVTEVSFIALARLGIEYLVNFNPRGSVELVTYHNGKLRVHHTDIEQLPTDAKRWELVGERQRASRLEETSEAVLSQGQERRAVEEFREQRYRLGEEIQVEASIPEPAYQPPVPRSLEMETSRQPASTPPPATYNVPEFASKSEAQFALERLRMSYIAGDLSREDYHSAKTAIEQAISTLPESEGPPRTLSLSNE